MFKSWKSGCKFLLILVLLITLSILKLGYPAEVVSGFPSERFEEKKKRVRFGVKEVEAKLNESKVLEELNNFEEPVEITSVTFYGDEGPIGATIRGINEKRLNFALDRKGRSKYTEVGSYIYLDVLYPYQNGRIIPKGGQAEEKILSYLKRGVETTAFVRRGNDKLIEKLEERVVN